MVFAALASAAVSAGTSEASGGGGIGGFLPASPPPSPDVITPTLTDSSGRNITFAPQFSGENSTNTGKPDMSLGKLAAGASVIALIAFAVGSLD